MDDEYIFTVIEKFEKGMSPGLIIKFMEEFGYDNPSYTVNVWLDHGKIKLGDKLHIFVDNS